MGHTGPVSVVVRAWSNNLPLALLLTVFAGVAFAFLHEPGSAVRTGLAVLAAGALLLVAARTARCSVVLGPEVLRAHTQVRTVTVPREAVTGVSALVVDRRGYGAVWAPVLEFEDGHLPLRMLAGYSRSADEGRAPAAVERRTAVIADWLAGTGSGIG